MKIAVEATLGIGQAMSDAEITTLAGENAGSGVQQKVAVAGFVPVTRDLGLRRIWAATIDYTPDHTPIIGPGLRVDGAPVGGVVVAAAAGHGMMWGPGIARAAVDLLLRGRTDVLEVRDLGLDRFDEHGRSRLATDPVTLPYPTDR